MTRFKKELRKRGVKLECDYPYLPFELVGTTLECVVVNSELCSVTEITTSITLTSYYGRNMQIAYQDCD